MYKLFFLSYELHTVFSYFSSFSFLGKTGISLRTLELFRTFIMNLKKKLRFTIFIIFFVETSPNLNVFFNHFKAKFYFVSFLKLLAMLFLVLNKTKPDQICVYENFYLKGF